MSAAPDRAVVEQAIRHLTDCLADLGVTVTEPGRIEELTVERCDDWADVTLRLRI